MVVVATFFQFFFGCGMRRSWRHACNLCLVAYPTCVKDVYWRKTTLAVSKGQRHATILACEDGHDDKDKLLCDLCHKPVKAPGGKSRPSIVRNILMYMSKFCFKFRKRFYRAYCLMMPMLVNILVKQVAIQSCIGSVMYRYITDWEQGSNWTGTHRNSVPVLFLKTGTTFRFIFFENCTYPVY